MKKLLSVVCAVVMALMPSGVAVAKLNERQMSDFSTWNVLYYDPGATGKNGCVTSNVSGNKVTVIGDSISEGAKSEYASQMPGADLSAKTYNGVTYNLVQSSKHFAMDVEGNYGGLTIADVLQEQGDLQTYLVFALGTNDAGGVTASEIDALMNLVGTNHKVVLTTNYGIGLDFSANNAAIEAAAARYSNVAVADWAAAVSANPEKYIGDNYVHPNAAGNQLYVKTIKEALNTFTAGGGTNGSTVTAGGNQNYAGAQVWSDAELAAIEAHQAIYEEGANKFGFPWQVLAVIHSLETGLQLYNPANGQGVYQLYSYTGGGTGPNRFPPADSISEEEFRRQTIIAAEVISGMAGDLNNPDNVKRLFFMYNGTAKVYIEKALAMGFSQEEAENGEGSPYVMNRYDAQRDPTSGAMHPAWPGRYVADGVYDPSATYEGFGAFVKYEALAGGSSAGYCESAGGSIVETAMMLAWDIRGGRVHGKDDPKPEYVTAMKEVDAYIQGCNSTGCAPIGASCDQFVGTVMRYSGADPEYPIFGPATQQSHMDSHPDMYEKVTTNEDFSALEPGDIFVTAGPAGNHIYIYLGEIDGEMAQASASFNQRTGEMFNGVYFSDEGGARVYTVYRRINYN